MDSIPTISIITPVWNGLPFLKECVESVLEQEFQDWEMIISDDGSTDGSRDYLDTLIDSRIRLYKQDKNLGIFGNLNFLFQKAKASISQILCQDDYFIKSTSLNVIINYWRNAEGSIGFVRFNHVEYSKCCIVNLERQITPTVITANHANIWFFVFGNIPGNLSNISLRTQIINDCGMFREDLPFAGDMEFWIRAAKKVSMGVQKDLLVYVRRHANVASNFLSQRGELFPQHAIIYENLINDLSQTYDRNLLISYFNYEICSYHFRVAIKTIIVGHHFDYIRTFINTQTPIFWPKWTRVIKCFPYAVLNGHQKLTLKMAKKLINTANE